MQNRQQATSRLRPSSGDIRDTAASQRGLRHNSKTRCCELTLMHETSQRRKQDCRRHASAHQLTSHSATLQICNFECGADISLGTRVRGSCSNAQSIVYCAMCHRCHVARVHAIRKAQGYRSMVALAMLLFVSGRLPETCLRSRAKHKCRWHRHLNLADTMRGKQALRATVLEYRS